MKKRKGEKTFTNEIKEKNESQDGPVGTDDKKGKSFIPVNEIRR